MKNKILILFVILELASGISLGIAFEKIPLFSENVDLMESIINAFASIYVGSLLGIMIPGVVYCIIYDKLYQFFTAVGYSIIGLFLFLIIYIFFMYTSIYESLPYYISSYVLPVLLPNIGAITGFNFALRKD